MALAYSRAGSGPPLVLVHGIGHRRQGWDAVLAEASPFERQIPADVPVTIAWGSHDRLLPRRQALLARDRLPQARFVRLAGCGHAPMTDDPALVAALLLRGSSRPLRPAGREPIRPTGAAPSP